MLRKVFKHWTVLAMLLLCLTASAQAGERLKMSTTTSTENSGLLSVLLPPFEKANDITVDVIAVGTGKALKLGENGDVDVVFVHARAAEDKFVADGFGVDRRDVMHNDFIIVGPANDPAELKAATSNSDAMKRLSEGKASFISRGDDSGTHKKEKALWKAAGIAAAGKWYSEAGQGMGPVLTIADEKGGYALADRGTYIAYSDKVDLVIAFDGGSELANPYGIIAVNPAKHPHVKIEQAKALIDYITGPEGQKIINSYKVKGKQLFFPDAIPNP
jgi:tungstate transport system substrate-binding protein